MIQPEHTEDNAISTSYIVTDIIPFDKKRQKVYINGEYVFWLYFSEIRRYHIEKDSQISEECLDTIRRLLIKRAGERILHLLEKTDRTESDIRNKLFNAGYTPEIINPVIDNFKEYGYINDSKYAALYAESLRDNHHKSRREIESKLYSKGISRDIISDVMDSMEFDEENGIVLALRRKGLTPEEFCGMEYKAKQKVYAYLMRKGFSPGNINECLKCGNPDFNDGE